MVSRPEVYFRVTRILWNSLRIPDYDRISRQENLTAGDIRRAFSDANGRHWEPEMAGAKLDSRGWLEQPSLGQMSVYGVESGHWITTTRSLAGRLPVQESC